MSLSNVSKALQIINNAVQQEQVNIETPISLKSYYVRPIKGEEALNIKNALFKRNKVNAKVTEMFYKIVHNNITLKGNESESFDEFMKTNSVFDTFEIIHGLNIVTFEKMKENETICPHCETINKIAPEYKQFKNISKKWDKEKKWDEYIINYDIELNEKVKMIFELKIPSLYHELMIGKQVLNTPIENNLIEQGGLITTNFEKAVVITNKITVITKIQDKESGELKEEILTLDNAHDIKLILEKLPEKYIEELVEKYDNEIKDYVPIYSTKHKCIECENEFDIHYEPTTEFIVRILM